MDELKEAIKIISQGLCLNQWFDGGPIYLFPRLFEDEPSRFRFKELNGWLENMQYIVDIVIGDKEFTTTADRGNIEVEPKGIIEDDLLSELDSHIMGIYLAEIYMPACGYTDEQIEGWYEGDLAFDEGKLVKAGD